MNPSHYDRHFLAAAFRLLLMDRLCFFSSETGERTELVLVTHSAGTNSSAVDAIVPGGDVGPYLQVLEDWTKPFFDLVKAWDSWAGVKHGLIPRSAVNSGTALSKSQSQGNGVACVHSLIIGLKAANGQSYMGKVEGNFTLAALALRAIMLVSAPFSLQSPN